MKVSMEKLRIYFDQIPDGTKFYDYPEDTVFVLDDTRPMRDPVTFQLIRSPAREMIYPEDCPSAKEEQSINAVCAVLDGYLHQLDGYQASLLQTDSESNTEDIQFLYHYLEETRALVEEAPDVYKALRVYRIRLTAEKIASLLTKCGMEPDLL